MKHTGEELELGSRTGKGSDTYSFMTADGVTSPGGFRTSELLLLDTANPETGDDIVVLRSNYGVLGILADYASDGTTVMACTSARAGKLTQLNMERNGIKNAETRLFSSLEQLEQGYDIAVYAPRPYQPVDVVKQYIIQGIELLEEGGELHVAGTEQAGINRVEKLLNGIPGSLEKIGQRGSCQAYRFQKTTEPGLEQPDTRLEFDAVATGVEAGFTTRKGLFSAKGIDDGTRLLLENVELEGEDTVLDLACGYGAISVFLARKYGCDVYLSDDSKVATRYARENLERNGVENFEVETADCLEGFNRKFDAIVSNPPTHQGGAIIDEMVEESYTRLTEGGKFLVVCNQGLGFEERLEDVYGDVEEIVCKDGYLVLEAFR